MFEGILTRTKQERETIASELKGLYRAASEDNSNCLCEYRKNKKSVKARAAYYESCQRIGAIIEVFDILKIPEDSLKWEPNLAIF